MKVMKTPRSVDIEITSRCNLRCKYCSHFSSPGDVSEDLPTEEWLKFFEELKSCAVTDVCLSGGEAFIREDLKEIIQAVVNNRMRFSILSNGTLISDEIAAFIASTKRCNDVQVSIDGSIPLTHDSFRGKGSFYKAVEGINHLLRNKVPVSVRVTIHRENVADLENIARLLLEDIGIPSFSTNSASYMGLCRKNAGQILLTHDERTLAMQTLLRLTEKYKDRISAQAGPLAEAQDWLEMENARKESSNPMPGRGYLTGCGGTMDTIAVRADGVFVPCGQMPHIELGRINSDDLQGIWQNHPELTRIRQRHLIPLGDFEFCHGCAYINYCTGNCPALAYTLYGNVNHPSPDACLRRFLEGGGRLPETVD